MNTVLSSDAEMSTSRYEEEKKEEEEGKEKGKKPRK